MRYDNENIKHNNSMYTKSFTYCDFGGIIQSSDPFLQVHSIIGLQKVPSGQCIYYWKTKKWVIDTVGGKQTHKNNHFMYLPKQNSAFGFCFTDASLTYKQVQSKAK